MFDPFQDWNPLFFKQQFNLIYLIEKNISIKVLKEALGANNNSEGAEYDDLEEANKGKMDNLFKTESETSNKEINNYKCVFLQENVH